MAKDVITRFKLETTAFDSKIKQAAKGLSDYSKTATQAGSEFDKFTRKNVEAARAIGTMATSSNNAKGKVQELVGAYNELAKTYEHLTDEQKQSDFAKAMAQSLTQLQQRIKETKQELYGLSNAAEQVKSKTGGMFGESGLTGMLAVTGGNLLASGITKLGSEIADTMQKSIELAKAGEGVRNAFERLNNPGLLNNLKEATHGTVSELELMKAAVKFDDFKLPVEQLGTLLAFAQKKAKDTGQSVDYMVDSIVTGLGRKSLMILDNLGLSAAQIKEKMAETGDMTKAVAEIIKEQMAQAGEYVETAADRAARAAADAANKMEDLGNKAMPVAEEWARAWNEISLGGMSLLTTVLGPIADSIRSIREALNWDFKFKPGIPNLAEGPQNPWANSKPSTDHKVQAPGGYVEVTDKNTGKVIGGKHFENLQDKNLIEEWRKSLVKTPKTGHTTTPQEQAAKQVAEAQRVYAETIAKADMELKSGLSTDADVKKKTLAAQEQLYSAYGKAYATYADPKYKEAQDNAAAEIVKLGGEVKTSVDAQKKVQEAARELERAQKKLADAQTKLSEAKATGDLKQIYTAKKAVDKAQADVTRLTQVVDVVPGKVELPDVPKAVTVPITYTSGNLDAFISNLKEQISQADIGSELHNKLTAQLADATTLGTLMQTAVQNGIDTAQFNPQDLWKKVFGDNPGDYINDQTWQSLVDQINEKLKELNIEPIKINFKTGNIAKDGKEVAKDWNNAASAISSVGSAMSQIEDPAAKVMGTIAQAIATIALTYAKSLEGTFTPWDWIAGAAAGLAQMTAVISAIHSSTGYAEGGVIKGNSYSGDNLMAQGPNGQLIGLNAGEVVLNRAQSANLASQLQGSGGQTVRVVGKLSGESLFLCAENWAKRTGKGEFVTWR